ncbi:IspD/TarI family cytidylyltransferase [Pollutimonas bauzanensis]|uniref:2-C-methyl-D-erythritol 4-phosphate cytidylyltransferase n=1 Tax=Pollutimonas bauzanensis TaxID=658167 RepID=A0A1M5Z0E3_9BURK|nr:2-C-methyl-D-erythritol 4-phosphate cytidylyltransferase [Pollutimonas bauzanensis]SHI17650.1 2-C-methyl-D-erythritol 4-phosphate cytidylyltransferase [Pollutimonas bauzanensis]
MHKKLIAIVPAAGIGARALEAGSARGGDAGAALAGAPDGGSWSQSMPKQYRLLKGEPMLRWAVRALLADERIAQVRVAVAAHDAWAEQALAGLPRTVWRPCGGPSRALTVLAALQDAGLGAGDWVLVHDAARPGLPADALRRLIDSCWLSNSGGLLAQPVADTVKLAAAARAVEPLSLVQHSVARERLWLAQTPQMFQAGRLRDALLAAGASSAAITDEASAMELAGYAPCLVRGSARNFKVTWPEDFELMERWL